MIRRDDQRPMRGQRGHVKDDAQEQEGDDEPGEEPDTERRVELVRVRVRREDAGVGEEDRGIGHPEAAVHGERCGGSNSASAPAAGENVHRKEGG